MKKTTFSPRTVFITVLALFFIISSTVIAVLSVNIYSTTASDDSADHLNSTSRYFSESIRRCENKENIRLAALKGSVPAMVITEHRDDSDADTERWLYAYDGYFMEYKGKKGSSVSPPSGKKMYPMKSVDFQVLNDDLIEISLISEEGTSSTLLINIADAGGIGNE